MFDSFPSEISTTETSLTSNSVNNTTAVAAQNTLANHKTSHTLIDSSAHVMEDMSASESAFQQQAADEKNEVLTKSLIDIDDNEPKNTTNPTTTTTSPSPPPPPPTTMTTTNPMSAKEAEQRIHNNINYNMDDDEFFSSSTSFQQSIYLDQQLTESNHNNDGDVDVIDGGGNHDKFEAIVDKKPPQAPPHQQPATNYAAIDFNNDDSEINFILLSDETNNTQANNNDEAEEDEKEDEENANRTANDVERTVLGQSMVMTDMLVPEEDAQMEIDSGASQAQADNMCPQAPDTVENEATTGRMSPSRSFTSDLFSRSHRRNFPRRRSLALKSSSDTVNNSNSENETDNKSILFYFI